MSATKTPWYTIEARSGGSASISILSDIGTGSEGSVTPASFARELKALGSPSRLDIHICSNGGDVTTGFAIYNLLAAHRARKTVFINGVAASMASVLAMVGDDIIMPDNSYIMIHDVWGAAVGGGDAIKSFGAAISHMQDSIVDVYAKRTQQPHDYIRQMMAEETWLSADEALKLGFATKVVAPQQMAASVSPRSLSQFDKIPKTLVASLTGKAAPKAKPRDPIAEIRAKSFAGFGDKPKAAPKSFDALATSAFAKFNAARRDENDGSGDA